MKAEFLEPTTLGEAAALLARQNPPLVKQRHTQEYHRISAKLSHNAQARISTLYTHNGTVHATAVGKTPSLWSANQLSELP